MSYSSLSDLFEYLFYGSTAIRYIFSLTVRGSTFYRRQILMTKVDPRAVRVKEIIPDVIGCAPRSKNE